MEKSYKDINNQVLSSDFKKFCKKELASSMVELEKCRQKYINYIYIDVFILVYCILVYCFLEYSNADYGSKQLIFYVFAIFIVIPVMLVNNYQEKAKKNILTKILSYIGNFEILNNSNIENYVRTLKLFKDYNSFSCDDCLKGVYKLLPINISEIDLRKITKVGKHRDVKIIFDGLLIVVPCNKKYSGTTIIKRNSAINIGIGSKKDKVNLEDMEFESLYDVYSTDQIEARYLITTAFMNRMVKLAKRGYDNDIILSFEKGNVNIALSSCKDWFEVPFFKPATNIANYRAIVFELISVLKIIDSLKLDQKIGM